MKKYKIELTEKEISHIESAMGLMVDDAEYGGKAYKEYSSLEASIRKKFKAAMNPLDKEALEDIRRTLKTSLLSKGALNDIDKDIRKSLSRKSVNRALMRGR